MAAASCTGGPAGDDEPTQKTAADLTTAPLPNNLQPFAIVGFIQSFSLDTPGDVLSAAKMMVNGITVTIPRNTIVTLPAAFMTPAELFVNAPPQWAPNASGMALQDLPRPLATYEATLEGNRVGDEYIAGLVHIAQQSLNATDGAINFIDYDRGELWVGGAAGTRTGARMKINDPEGRYGRVFSPDVRFQVDSENPTIHASTGYPMCIPRTDPAGPAPDALCPESNRPRDPETGLPLSNFVMAHPQLDAPTDPTKQAPFEVGDTINFAGNLETDDLGEYIAAHTIDANLGIFTEPGTQPSYLTVEELLVGAGGDPIPGLPQEATIRFTLVGFTTDPSALVDVFAIDVSPCSGIERERLIATANPQGNPLRGRFRVMVDALNIKPLFRELRLISRNGQTPDVANGLVAGQYRTPVGEFIFPENFVLGSATVPVSFQDFPFLAQGSGPLEGTGPLVGQLSPWPGMPAPPPAICEESGNAAPIANAGPDLTVISNATVRLNGNKSFDPDFGPLGFQWTAPPGIVLSNPSSASPSFVAPSVPRGGMPVSLTFSLTVTDNVGSTATDTMTVAVQPAGDTVTITGATFRVRRSILTVTATSDDPARAALLSLLGFGVMTNNGDGTYTYSSIGQVNPGVVTVNSSLGGSASAAVTIIP